MLLICMYIYIYIYQCINISIHIVIYIQMLNIESIETLEFMCIFVLPKVVTYYY